MATKKPRITITLQPADYEVLVRLSALNGESMSSIVSELVGTVAPSLARVADVLEVASTAQVDVLENLRRVVTDGEATLSPLITAGADGFDEVAEAMLNAVRPPAK